MSFHLPKSPSWSISENCSLQLPQTWNSKVFLLQKKLDFTVNWWLLNSRFHGVISPSWTTAAVNRSTIETTTTKISRRTQSWDFRFQAKASCDGLSLNPNCANREMKIGQKANLSEYVTPLERSRSSRTHSVCRTAFKGSFFDVEKGKGLATLQIFISTQQPDGCLC